MVFFEEQNFLTLLKFSLSFSFLFFVSFCVLRNLYLEGRIRTRLQKPKGSTLSFGRRNNFLSQRYVWMESIAFERL